MNKHERDRQRDEARLKPGHLMIDWVSTVLEAAFVVTLKLVQQVCKPTE